MDQTPQAPEPASATRAHSSPAPPPRPPQALRITAGPGGLFQAIGFVIGVFLFGIVFVGGLALGALAVAAGSMFQTNLYEDTYRDGGAGTVAVIPVEGTIDGGRAEVVRIMVKRVLELDSVKAVVLRVNSPGGGIAPSDEIWYQVRKLKDEGLPVVASFGALAASGGYYVSCGTDCIFAEPTTITGSIGVIAQTFVVSDLLENVGVEPVTLLATDSPEKDLGNPLRPWTEKDRQKYVALLDAAYAIFCDKVRTGRESVITDPDRVDRLADGSIYTAAQAQANGLVDKIGYLDDAIAHAETLGGIATGTARVVVLREPASPLGSLLGARGRPARRSIDAETVRTFVNDLSAPRVMYLMR